MKESKKDENLIRLQKIISQAGISSRREAERLIIEGRVLVNGNVVRELGAKADPRTDDIRVDGKKLKRIKYGFLELGNLKPGEYRSLSSQEAKRLMETTGR